MALTGARYKCDALRVSAVTFSAHSICKPGFAFLPTSAHANAGERAIPEPQIAELRGEMIDEYAHLERYAPAVQYQYVDHHVSHRKIREHCAQPAHVPIFDDIPRQSQTNTDASQPP